MHKRDQELSSIITAFQNESIQQFEKDIWNLVEKNTLHLDPKKSQFFANITLRKKPSHSELFRSKFFRIQTEYGVIIK